MLTKKRRHWLTGEWEEVPVETVDGRATFHYEQEKAQKPTKGIRAFTALRPFVSTAIAINPNQVDSMNREVQKAGIRGVRYRTDGKMSADSAEGRAKELKRRRKVDDWSGI